MPYISPNYYKKDFDGKGFGRKLKPRRPPVATIAEIAKSRPSVGLGAWYARFDKVRDQFELILDTNGKKYYRLDELNKWANALLAELDKE